MEAYTYRYRHKWQVCVASVYFLKGFKVQCLAEVATSFALQRPTTASPFIFTAKNPISKHVYVAAV